MIKVGDEVEMLEGASEKVSAGDCDGKVGVVGYIDEAWAGVKFPTRGTWLFETEHLRLLSQTKEPFTFPRDISIQYDHPENNTHEYKLSPRAAAHWAKSMYTPEPETQREEPEPDISGIFNAEFLR